MTTLAASTDPTAPARPAGRRRPAVFVAAALVLAVVGLFVAWNNGLRGVFFAKNFGVIEAGKLFRSGQISRWQIDRTLGDHGVKVIVAMSGHGGPPADLAAEMDAVRRLGIRREVFPLGGDGTGQVAQYVGAVAAVDRAVKAHEPVLVHCIAGAQRTGGVIALYELLVERRPAAEAYAELQRFGHDPRDNPKLVPYLDDHMREVAEGLMRAKVIDRVPDPLPVLPRD